MTERIVAIDCGTTATKAWVVVDGQVIAGGRATGGVRDVARDKDRAWLRDHLRRLADSVLDDAGIAWTDVRAVIAFGMVTSELGLEEVPHLPTPIERSDLARSMREAGRDTFPAPVRFVPGVIYNGDGHVTTTDFMRGEETEVAGLLSLDVTGLPALFVSPGSHTKFVILDRAGRITWSFTTLSGELVWALSQETILAGLVDPAGSQVDVSAVDEGAATADRYGLSRALYGARLLSRIEGASPERCSSFILGAVASCDLAALRSAREDGIELPGEVRIAHGPPMSSVYHRLIDREGWASDTRTVDEPLGAFGAWALFRAAEDELTVRVEREARESDARGGS
jgi:2-dehydro-3-deoxygalactonokinase